MSVIIALTLNIFSTQAIRERAMEVAVAVKVLVATAKQLRTPESECRRAGLL